MRVHLCGADCDNEYGLEFYVKKALEELKCSVVCTSYRVLNPQEVEIRLRNITDVDFLFVIKGERVCPEAVFLSKVPKLLWMQDSIVANKEAYDVIKNRAWAYNRVYTFDPAEIPIYENLGVDSKWLPLGVPSDFCSVRREIEQDIDIGFIGSLTDSRVALIEYLLQRYPVQYTCSYTNYKRTILRTKINLNMGIRTSGIQMRVFEVLACGGFLLTNQIEDEHKLFDEDCLVYYTNADIFDFIDYYLPRSDLRKKIAEQGRKEVLRKHTYRHRMEKVIDDVKRDLQ